MRQLPWWRVASLALLSGALAIALASGHTLTAVITAVLMIPTLMILGASVYQWVRERRAAQRSDY